MVQHRSSTEPVEDIKALTYPGQDPARRNYKQGYEHFLDEMPVLEDGDKFLQQKVDYSYGVMKSLSAKVIEDGWTKKSIPEDNGFKRTIIAIESPIYDCLAGVPNSKYPVKENAEILIAQWGKGHTSPIHGHASGYLHEEILHGKLLVNQYRLMPDNMVRLVRTDIIDKARTFLSEYNKKPENMSFLRPHYIHNFIALEPTATMHYLPEHTRDGRGNRFAAQYFEDVFQVMDDVKRISAQDGMRLRIGDVVLVRSSNVPDYGDHYIVVTGHPVMKEHGLRVQDVAISAPNIKLSLDELEGQELILLKFSDRLRDEFLDFHGIEIKGKKVLFPETK